MNRCILNKKRSKFDHCYYRHDFSFAILCILLLHIKMFVDMCNEINTYEVMLTNFVGNIYKQMFYQLWNVRPNTLIINRFIITWYGRQAQSPLSFVTFHDVIVFLVTIYTLIHFWLGTQKSNTNLNNQFLLQEK